MTILEVTTAARGDGQVQVELHGELDLSTVGKVEEELRRIEADAPPVLVVDMSGLSFLDSSGLRCLVRADERARETDRRLVLVRGPDAVQKVFEITRLEERLEFVGDASEIGDDA